MQREIKFRAWDKKQLRMLSVYSLSKPLVTVIDYKTTGKEAIDANPMVNLNEVEPYRDISSNEVELMQFTGFKDKNGVEIYEGDIVRVNNLSTHWKRGAPDFDWRILEIKWNRYVWQFNNSVMSFPFSDYDLNTLEPYDIEVIGNIHENPALLSNPQ